MDYKIEALDMIKKPQDNDFLSIAKLKYKELCEKEKQEIIFFGAGIMGIDCYNYFCNWGFKVNYFCDNDPQKKDTVILDGIKCLSPTELKTLNNPYIIITITSEDIRKSVKAQLKSYGLQFEDCFIIHTLHYLEDKGIVKKIKNSALQIGALFDALSDLESKKILFKKLEKVIRPQSSGFYDCGDIYSQMQYFPLDIIESRALGTFIDCGAFVGDTLDFAIKHRFFAKSRRYICYELSKLNFEVLGNFIHTLNPEMQNKIEAFNLGVGKRSGEILYNEMQSSSGVIDKRSGTIGKMISLDTHLGAEKIGFIKMDIEGSEVDAIQGAVKVIKRDKPILAICIYHNFEDLWEIPLLIKELVPEYKLYIRHHEYTMYETVCYAISEGL